LQLNLKAITAGGANAIASVATEATGIIEQLLTGAEPSRTAWKSTSRAIALREKPIMTYTIADKLKGDAIDITVRIAVWAKPAEAQAIMRSIWYAYRTVDGDNQVGFVATQVKKEWPRFLDRSPGLKLNRDYVSVKEVAGLIGLPAQPLQKEYGMEPVDYRETKLPQIVTFGGLKIGTSTYRGQAADVSYPQPTLMSSACRMLFLWAWAAGRPWGSALIWRSRQSSTVWQQ
jgi:hypothetical protein